MNSEMDISKNWIFQKTAAQCKTIYSEGLNWPGRLADISEGAR